MTADEYMRSLEKCAWFNGLPDAARERVSREVAQATAEELEPWMNIPTYLQSDEVETLGKIGPGASSAVPHLRLLLTASDNQTRTLAQEALKAIADTRP